MDPKKLEKKYNDTPERKTTRGILYRWGRVTDICNQNHEEIRAFQKLMDEVGELRERSEVHVSGGKTADPTESAVENLDEMRNEYQGIIDSITKQNRKELRLKRLIDKHVNGLSPIERRIIHLKYKEHRSNVFTAIKTGMSESYVRSIEREAVDKLSKAISVK